MLKLNLENNNRGVN